MKPEPDVLEAERLQAILPFHLGSSRSSQLFGSSAGFTMLVLMPGVATAM